MTTPDDLNTKVHRVKFRRWAELEDLREQFSRAAGEGAEDFPKKFFAYLTAALDIKEDELAGLPWTTCVDLFYAIYLANLPSPTLPLITSVPKESKKATKLEWDYPGRLWYFYAHLIAGAYGWTLDYIAELETDEALALVQEILTEEQLEKEFTWGLSEIAYSYNKATKSSSLRPLPRPAWMLPAFKDIKPMKIARDMLPQGLVLDAGNNTEVKW